MASSLRTEFARAAREKRLQRRGRPAYWDKSVPEAWRAGHSDERRQEDARLLSRLAEVAESVPVLRDTLAWARETGLEFIIDRTLKTGVQAGYYTPGSGVVAIAAWCFAGDDLAEAVATAAHETRHAWQEVQRLSPNISPTCTDYTLRLAVVEADATAHEKLALRQYADFRAGKAAAGTDIKNEMWGYFMAWYGTLGSQYAGLAESSFAEYFGLPVAAGQPSYADIRFEFTPEPPEAIAFPGIEIARPEQFRRLAKTYGGANYFDAAEPDFLQRVCLSPGRAAAQFGTGAPDALALQIRRCELRQTFAGRKMRCPGA